MFDKILIWSFFFYLSWFSYLKKVHLGEEPEPRPGGWEYFLFLVYVGTQGWGEIFLSFSSSTQVAVGAVHSRVLSLLPPQLSLLPTNTTSISPRSGHPPLRLGNKLDLVKLLPPGCAVASTLSNQTFWF